MFKVSEKNYQKISGIICWIRALNNPIHLKNRSLLPSLVSLGITAELCSHCIFRPDDMYITFSSWKIQANYWCHDSIYLTMGCSGNHELAEYFRHSSSHFCQFFFQPRRLPKDKSDPEAWINDKSLETWLKSSLNSSMMQWLFNLKKKKTTTTKKKNKKNPTTPDVTVLETPLLVNWKLIICLVFFKALSGLTNEYPVILKQVSLTRNRTCIIILTKSNDI